MSLKLYYHPLSSFCHKALIALHEHGVDFDPILVNLGDADSTAEMFALWPIGKFPVLRDENRGQTVAEATVIVEYLDLHYAGDRPLLPADPDLAWKARMWDRLYDLYVNVQLQKIVTDRLRPAEARDPLGVEQAESMIRKCYGMIETEMAGKEWAMGEDFGIVDCAAAPALFYASFAVPVPDSAANVASYLDRLMARPSYARVLQAAEPYFNLVPLERKPRLPEAA
ncbi:hypothetical protein A7A08_03136 [Methyloligella halotolerans]|uniref:Glutathione S-transferase n=1 Tax=Methyloligella halotolerans TaxID=1177755 RepID=A0A1E2RV09_9HYPH|nr:glutathione S-transferase family protein [Methyloligella halotolerans]ODA65992.1 hypothetical protein A7A08_03136 [Methyloligella halotolerans]